ncbi:hypothetical protein FALBO_677 [Fusarium albosuccineum]|uniref:Uncharacterized protein n=1 Tax=Fusarium albosuccineum TaxID=1237068 RepID=A0A8H4LPL0_9HYPO|nr:hypothetical protein FALBO_677 [Fusarium albosuccineum]
MISTRHLLQNLPSLSHPPSCTITLQLPSFNTPESPPLLHPLSGTSATAVNSQGKSAAHAHAAPRPRTTLAPPTLALPHLTYVDRIENRVAADRASSAGDRHRSPSVPPPGPPNLAILHQSPVAGGTLTGPRALGSRVLISNGAPRRNLGCSVHLPVGGRPWHRVVQ